MKRPRDHERRLKQAVLVQQAAQLGEHRAAQFGGQQERRPQQERPQQEFQS